MVIPRTCTAMYDDGQAHGKNGEKERTRRSEREKIDAIRENWIITSKTKASRRVSAGSADDDGEIVLWNLIRHISLSSEGGKRWKKERKSSLAEFYYSLTLSLFSYVSHKLIRYPRVDWKRQEKLITHKISQSWLRLPFRSAIKESCVVVAVCCLCKVKVLPSPHGGSDWSEREWNNLAFSVIKPLILKESEEFKSWLESRTLLVR